MSNPKIYAFMATLPGRAGIAKKALASIIWQVEQVQVVLNNFKIHQRREFDDSLPVTWLNKVTVIQHNNALADGSRFLNVDKCPPGYVLVFDDDIIYPPDYVATLIEAHKKYGGFVTCMGKILKARPIRSYYKDVFVSLKAFAPVVSDTPVQIPGACGILWHNSEVKVSTKDMLIPNSDLCLAKYAKDNGIRCMVVKHSATWLTNLWTGEVTREESIYGRYKKNDAIQTDFVNKYL